MRLINTTRQHGYKYCVKCKKPFQAHIKAFVCFWKGRFKDWFKDRINIVCDSFANHSCVTWACMLKSSSSTDVNTYKKHGFEWVSQDSLGCSGISLPSWYFRYVQLLGKYHLKFCIKVTCSVYKTYICLESGYQFIVWNRT